MTRASWKLSALVAIQMRKSDRTNAPIEMDHVPGFRGLVQGKSIALAFFCGKGAG